MGEDTSVLSKNDWLSNWICSSWRRFHRRSCRYLTNENISSWLALNLRRILWKWYKKWWRTRLIGKFNFYPLSLCVCVCAVMMMMSIVAELFITKFRRGPFSRRCRGGHHAFCSHPIVRHKVVATSTCISRSSSVSLVSFNFMRSLPQPLIIVDTFQLSQ